MKSTSIPRLSALYEDSRIKPHTVNIHEKNLQTLLSNSGDVLFSMKTVFPFDIFPDHITIESNQVNFSKKSFFSSYHIQSIPIKNVADVLLNTSVFFASLKVIDSSYIENSIQVDYLHKSDAIKARKIIQGLVIASKNDIDTSKITTSDLTEATEIIGEAQNIDM